LLLSNWQILFAECDQRGSTKLIPVAPQVNKGFRRFILLKLFLFAHDLPKKIELEGLNTQNIFG
jgi:hypothetical protein